MLAAHIKQIGYYLVPQITVHNRYERQRKQANLLTLSRQACLRLEWLIYYETKGEKNAQKTCRHFGIAPKTFYKWRKRFDGVNLRLLETESRAPNRTRKREMTPLEEARVVELRKKHIRWGKIKLAKVYETMYGSAISSWKVQYTIVKYRLYYNPKKNALTQAKRKRSKEKKRITELAYKPFPGFLIALDTIVLWWNGAKRYILTAIDTTSKIAFARMYTTKSSRNAKDFIQRVAYLLDYELWNTCHDNGSEFQKEFQEAIVELKLGDYWSRVKTPTDNPVNERFNRTLKEEFIALGNMTTDPGLFNRNLTEWLIEYSFVRPHQSLGYETPWEYYAKANKLLPMHSSRTCSCVSVLVCYSSGVFFLKEVFAEKV